MTDTSGGETKPSGPAAQSSAPVPSAPTSDRRPCPACAEAISTAANKCVHCGSELSWRRHIAFSTTTLALITAFIAVLGTVGPSIKSLFEYRDAFLNFTFVGAGSMRTIQDGRLTNASVVLLGSNEGNAAGGLVAARLQISWSIGGKRHFAAALLRTSLDEPIVVAPRATQSIRLLFDPSIDPLGATSTADLAVLIEPTAVGDIQTMPLWKADCSINLTVADASADTKDIIIPARCGPMMPAIVQAIRSPGIGM
jgi:hypothetical protein